VTKWLEPILKKRNLNLWDVIYKKEGSEWFLRVFIDADRPIGTDDCENVSKELDVILDKEDPIDQSYYLEVSSPGIDRLLRKKEHFEKFIGHDVEVKLFKEINGLKNFNGKLISFVDNVVKVEVLKDNKEIIEFDISKAVYVKLFVIF
jgi:ribosome maturation factor RimP